MQYIVQILCVIMLTVVLSLINCQQTENSPRGQTGHPAPANIRRLPNIQRNQEKFSANRILNVIVFLLFLYLILIISNIFVLKFFRNIDVIFYVTLGCFKIIAVVSKK